MLPTDYALDEQCVCSFTEFGPAIQLRLGRIFKIKFDQFGSFCDCEKKKLNVVQMLAFGVLQMDSLFWVKENIILFVHRKGRRCTSSLCILHARERKNKSEFSNCYKWKSEKRIGRSTGSYEFRTVEENFNSLWIQHPREHMHNCTSI